MDCFFSLFNKSISNQNELSFFVHHVRNVARFKRCRFGRRLIGRGLLNGGCLVSLSFLRKRSPDQLFRGSNFSLKGRILIGWIVALYALVEAGGFSHPISSLAESELFNQSPKIPGREGQSI